MCASQPSVSGYRVASNIFKSMYETRVRDETINRLSKLSLFDRVSDDGRGGDVPYRKRVFVCTRNVRAFRENLLV